MQHFPATGLQVTGNMQVKSFRIKLFGQQIGFDQRNRMSSLGCRQAGPPDKIRQCSRGMALKIQGSQSGERLFAAEFFHRRHTFFQQSIGRLLVFIYPTAHKAIRFSTDQKIMYQVIVCLDPCPTEPIHQLLFCQTLVSTQQLFQQSTTFRIEAFGYLHLPASCIRIEGCPYTTSRQLQHPADILCYDEMPGRS